MRIRNDLLHIILCLFVVSTSVRGEVTGGRALTLNECIRLALENNAEIQVERYKASAAIVNRDRAVSLFYPEWRSSLNNIESTAPSVLATDTLGSNFLITDAYLQHSTGIFGKLPTEAEIFTEFSSIRTTTSSANALLSPYYSSRWTFGVSQPLLQGIDWFGSFLGDTYAELQVADTNKKRSTWEFKAGLANIMLRIEQAYWRVMASHQIWQARKEALNITEQQLNVVQQKIEAGLSVPADIYEVKERRAARSRDVIRSQQEFNKAKAELLGLLFPNSKAEKVDQYWDFELPSLKNDIQPYALTRDALLETLDQRNFVLKALVLQKKSTQMDMKSKKSLLLPVLDVDGSFFLNGGNTPITPGYGADLNELLNPRSHGWSIGFNLEVPLGPSPEGAQYKLARLQHLQAKSQHDNERTRIVIAALHLYEDLKAGKGLIEKAGETVGLARKKMEFEQEKFKSGLSTSFNVLQYQQDLTDAKIIEAFALRDYRITVGQLDALAGRILEKYSIDIREQDGFWAPGIVLEGS